LHPLFLHIVPIEISVKLFVSFSLVLLIEAAAICCKRAEDIVGLIFINGKSADGLGNETGFGE